MKLEDILIREKAWVFPGMTMASGAMKLADTPTVAMVSAVMGTPNIIMASILRLVSNGASRNMFTAAVITSSGCGRPVVVVVVLVVVVVVATDALTPRSLKSPFTKGAIPKTGCVCVVQGQTKHP